MNKEEIKIKEFDKEQLELLLKDLQDINKFTGFKDGAFKYELGKYQANLLVNCIKKYKEVINKAIDFYETYKQECVIGRTRDGKLIKDYYLPAQLSKDLIEILTGKYNVK